MKIKAIFFDAGETLVYRNPSLLEITRRFLKINKININKSTLAKILNSCALKMKPIVEQGNVADSKKWYIYINMVFKKSGIRDKKIMHELIEKLRIGTSFRAYPDAKKILKFLKKSGFKLGVISNASASVIDILKKTRIYDFFDGVIVSEIVGYEKPDVKIFNYALKTLKVKPRETIYIGDNYIADIKGSIKAGIIPVWLRRRSKNNEFSYSGKKSRNVYVIRKISELIKLIKKEGWN